MMEEKKTEVTNINKRKKNEEINPVDKKMIKFMETLENHDDSRMRYFLKAPTEQQTPQLSMIYYLCQSSFTTN